MVPATASGKYGATVFQRSPIEYQLNAGAFAVEECPMETTNSALPGSM
jgi:hypothetical protein